MNDSDLLREYTQSQSAAAFAELSRRYVPLVYSAALRQTKDRHDAEDVTQAVFLLLMQKSRSFRDGVVIPAWLLRATHFTARTLLRSKRRRQRHESRAAMQVSQPDPSEAMPLKTSPDWERISPLLDEAIASLNVAQRDVLTLRVFRGQSFREVSERLSISEPAARQRLVRAVEQVRQFLHRRGATVAAGALEASIASFAIHPAPKALHASVAAFGTGSKVVPQAALAHAAAGAMSSKFSAVVAASIGLLLMGGTAAVLHHRGSTAAATAARPRAVDTTAEAEAVIRGRVVDLRGSPVAGAEVLLTTPAKPVSVYGAPADNALLITSAADGSFELPGVADAKAIVARSEQGVAQVLVSAVRHDPTVRLTPWASIQGRVRVGNTPVRNQVVELSRFDGTMEEWQSYYVQHGTQAKTDSQGRFSFPRVYPSVAGTTIAQRLQWKAPAHVDPRFCVVRPAPGQTIHLDLGGTGRPIIGKLDLPGGLPAFHGVLYEIRSSPATTQATSGQASSGQTTAGVDPRIFPVSIEPDGSFRIDDVPAGAYYLNLGCTEPIDGSPVQELLAMAALPVAVAPMPGGRSDEPQDLGKVAVQLNQLLRVGTAAPPFVATGVDAKEIRLQDFRGKYLLLCVRQDSQQPDGGPPKAALQAMFDRFGDDPRFAMLEIRLMQGPSTQPAARPTDSASWTRAVARSPFGSPAPADHAFPAIYCNGPTRLYLVDPDGKCAARSLSYASAVPLLEACLSPRADQPQSARVIVSHHPTGMAADAPFANATFDDPANLARAAQYDVVAGQLNAFGGGLAALHDGQLPAAQDVPAANCYFDFGQLEGRIRIDLRQPRDLAEVDTFSWHKSHRAPQLYTLYGASDASAGINLSPGMGVDPATCGWVKIAQVDSRPKPASEPDGGQYRVRIVTDRGSLGRFRYLLLVTFATEAGDQWGQTFFSEIAVLAKPTGAP